MRMNNAYDVTAPKKAANLTVNSDLLSQAKLLGINISAVLEQSLAAEVRKVKAQAWVRENQSAIQAYNQDVEQNRTFGEDTKSF
jgi:antitoxin CcdA